MENLISVSNVIGTLCLGYVLFKLTQLGLPIIKKEIKNIDNPKRRKK